MYIKVKGWSKLEYRKLVNCWVRRRIINWDWRTTYQCQKRRKGFILRFNWRGFWLLMRKSIRNEGWKYLKRGTKWYFSWAWGKCTWNTIRVIWWEFNGRGANRRTFRIREIIGVIRKLNGSRKRILR